MNKRIAQILVVVLMSTAVFPVMAQEKRMLMLKEAIDLSIKNSKHLKAGRARIDEATASVKEALDNRLPNFGITGSYLRLNSPNIALKTKTSSSSTGGSTASTTPSVNQAAYGLANLSYPIFAGGRIKYGIESAKYLEKAAQLDADNDKEAVALNTINAYTNLYKARAAVVLVQESLGTSRQRDSTFTRLETNGLLARNDLLKTELQTSNIELNLLDAENNWSLANVNMNLMLGLPEDTELLTDSTGFQQLPAIKNIGDYESLALQNRKDIQALSFRKKAVTTSIKSAKAEAYPSIALSGGYVAAYVPNFITITNAINVGIGVQYNLASLWKTNTKLLQAKAKEQEVSANEEDLNDHVRLQVNQDFQNYLLGQKKIDVYSKAVFQATENYRITKNKYDNSLVTTTDLLEVDVAQLQAKLNLAFAKADAITAYYKLLQTAGMLTY